MKPKHKFETVGYTKRLKCTLFVITIRNHNSFLDDKNSLDNFKNTRAFIKLFDFQFQCDLTLSSHLLRLFSDNCAPTNR